MLKYTAKKTFYNFSCVHDIIITYVLCITHILSRNFLNKSKPQSFGDNYNGSFIMAVRVNNINIFRCNATHTIMRPLTTTKHSF